MKTQSINTPYLYFPLVNEAGMISSITPGLKGDIKADNNSFLTPPTSRSDLIFTNSSRNFWIYSHSDNKSWPLAAVDNVNDNDHVEVETGLLYHKVIRTNKRLKLQAEITNFIPVCDSQAELMLIKITNLSSKSIEITPTSAIPLFCRSADNLRDHRHVTSLLNRIKQDTHGIIVQPTMSFDERGHKINNKCYYAFGIDNKNCSPQGSFPTIESLTQDISTINAPEAILKNLPAEKLTEQQLNGKEAIAGLRFKKVTIRPKQSIEYCLILGISQNQKDIRSTFTKFNTIEKAHKALDKNKKFWDKKSKTISFDTREETLDNWLKWVGIQPTLRKICGCSFLPDFDYGRGGKGWRDIWQDCLTLLLSDPKSTKELISANFRGIRIDSTNATIVTDKPGVFLADRNKISRVWMDHGIWPFFTLNLYINQTSDISILLKKSPYFRDTQICMAKDIDHAWDGNYQLKDASGKTYSGTIIEHILIQHIVPFFNVGKHNSMRLLCADWNDGLDMAEQKGESVAFSAFYAHNLRSIADTLEKLKTIKKIKSLHLAKELFTLIDTPSRKIDYSDPGQKIKALNKYLASTKLNVSGVQKEIKIDALIKDLNRKADSISQTIAKHEWIKINKDLGFFNGYYDNKSKRLEGTRGKDIKMSLTAQVFPILAGIASDKQVETIYKTAKKFLQDKKLKGFRLNTNYKTLQPDMGRAFAFSYGDKENGAIFSHMCVMFAYSLYSRGFAKQGFEVLNSLYELSISPLSKVHPNLPEYFDIDGQGLYSFLTGSASWYIMTLLTQVFGIKGDCGDLIINPKLVAGQFKKSDKVSVSFTFANKPINITFLNPTKRTYPNYKLTPISSNIKITPINKNELRIKQSSITTTKSDQIQIVIRMEK